MELWRVGQTVRSLWSYHELCMDLGGVWGMKVEEVELEVYA